MNPIEKLEKEHEDIEIELVELEGITESETINYPNLIHVFRKLCEVWNAHEEKEEKVFSIFKKEEIIIPVKKMLCDHGELKPYREKILKAINSGSEFQVKQVLEEAGKTFIEKLRKHIKDEDEVLYRTSVNLFTEDELKAIETAVDN
jgi:hemerythrin-like domain-containing protein